MSRTIDITVNGCYVLRGSKTAGTQGESNVTTLHLTLDDSWQGLGKRIIWRDAAAGSPVVSVLFHPDGTSDTLTYDVTIPAEPLALPGWMSATLEGYTLSDEGTVSIARTAEIRLEVLMNDGLYAPAEPTDTELAQIYDRLGAAEQNLLDYVASCEEAAETCTTKRQLIENYAVLARTFADRAKYYADSVGQTSTDLNTVEARVTALSAALAGKLSQSLDAEYAGLYLIVDDEGNIVPADFEGGGAVTSVAGRTGGVVLTTDDVSDLVFGESLTMALRTLHNSKPDRMQPDYAGKLWAVAEDGDLCFVDPVEGAAVAVDDTLSVSGAAADAYCVGQAILAIPVSAAADGYTELENPRKVTAVDFSTWEAGRFTVTRDGGVTEQYAVTFDGDSRPVTITDGAGHVTAIGWG